MAEPDRLQCWCTVLTIVKETTRVGYISPEPVRLNGNTLYRKQPAFRCGEKVRRPCVECGALLLCPVVPLINPDYASAASAQMIQHRLGDFEAHAEALQPCRKRPAQVMQPPAGNTGRGIER